MSELKKYLGLLALPLMAMAACGSGGGSLIGAVDAAPIDQRTEEQLLADQQAAQAAVLVLADLPAEEGWHVGERPAMSEDEREAQRRNAECIGLPVEYFSGTAAHGRGETLTQGNVEVDSKADVLPTVAEAEDYMGIFGSPEGRRCLVDTFWGLIETEPLDGAEVVDVSVVRLAPRPIGDQVAGARLTVTIEVDGDTASMIMDSYSVRRGRAVGSVLFAAPGLVNEAYVNGLLARIAVRLPPE